MASSISNQLLIAMEQLAAQASIPNMKNIDPSLPPGWSLDRKIFNISSAPMDPVVIPNQGFLSHGPDGNGNVVYVLALGITWTQYLAYQYDGQFNQQQLPEAIAGKTSDDCKVMTIYSRAYQALRKPLWDVLPMAGTKKLYLCGMSLGAPLAQIAALDLRPGNIGPDNQDAPTSVTPCYTFSVGNIATKAMADYYKTKAPESYTHWVKTNLIVVDNFPLEPTDNDWQPLGQVTLVPSKIPLPDVPWWERSDVFYLQAIGGTPIPGVAIAPSFPNPPPGFDPVLASSMTQLIAAAYQLGQHPGATIPSTNFTLEDTIEVNDTPFALVFSSPTTIAVAIRGCTTWDEFNGYTADSGLVHPSFAPTNSSHVQRGAYNVYESQAVATTSGKTGLFGEVLYQVIKPLLTGTRKLVVTGHSLGGAIANIAAADYAMSSERSLAVGSVYTFGCILMADYAFAQDYTKVLGDKSYQIRRLSDRIATATAEIGLQAVDKPVVLNGSLEIDEMTHHSLYGYLNLLNVYTTDLLKKANRESVSNA